MIGLTGSTGSLFDKSKFEGFFDGVFISARAAHVTGQPILKKILAKGTGVVAVEGSKFLVPLTKNMRSEFDKKIYEYASTNGLKNIEGIYRWDRI